jgi:hypothetical protein
MTSQLFCPNDARRALVRDNGTLNGIDYLEVLDTAAPAGTPRQQTLLVHAFRDVSALDAGNVRIDGGVRITPVRVSWAFSADRVLAGEPDAAGSAPLAALLGGLPAPENVLVVRTDVRGDFSTYTLRLVAPAPGAAEPPPDGFDPQLASVGFSFKVECPSEFDCAAEPACAEPRPAGPPIDYLAKDFASFRRLMLDRLAITMPAWTERSAGDLGVALVEVLAYAADHLSYHQDAVATEAYLGTARRRVSVRRHARLVDYFVHDGANARAWVAFEVEAGSAADGAVLPAGTQLLTETAAPVGPGAADPAGAAEDAGALVFETMEPLALTAARSRILFHTWGDDRCCLPRGATRATLARRGPAGLVELEVGDVLVLEEVRSPDSLAEADADPRHRHAVRLTEVVPATDPLFTEEDDPYQELRVLEVAWDPEDALPFTLRLWEVADPDDADLSHPVAVARGNVVLADHGRTVAGEALPALPAAGRYRPSLARWPLTRQGRVVDAEGDSVTLDRGRPASAALRWELADVRPAVTLASPETPGVAWEPRPDLLGSDRFATEFVVESEEEGTTFLRFGDGLSGRLPVAGLVARYRVGNGRAGNVGADALTRVLGAPEGIARVRNPLPAVGGEDPEPLADVRKYAPQAFRRQERAVTEADYAAAAQRHPEVQRAAATRRWTGSWYTMFVTVDRRGGCAVDAAFEAEMRAHLERFRLAGHDLEIDSPRFVPLDLLLQVCVKPGSFRADVKRALLETLGSRDLGDGRRGFFHPDNLTFAQPVYLSAVIAAAMRVAGVAWVKPVRFQRWGEPPRGELAAGELALDRLEIARLDNDPSLPENGRIDFQMEGGL